MHRLRIDRQRTPISGLWSGILRCGVLVGCFTSAAAPAWADEIPEKLVVATWNLEWFFDHDPGDNRSELAKKMTAPSKAEWDWKRQHVAEAIATLRPDILALQEIENKQVLWDLVGELREKHDLSYRIAFIEGTDPFTEQDVALLFRGGLVEFSRREQTGEMWVSKEYYNVQKHILGRFEWGQGAEKESLLVVNVHLRARAQAAKLRAKQTRLLRHWIEEALARGENVMALGDFNTEETYAGTTTDSELGVLRGLSAEPDVQLTDLHQSIAEEHRVTHMIGKQFDRILVSPAMLVDAPGRRDLVFKKAAVRKDLTVRGARPDADHWNIYYTIDQKERDLSDHYPVVAEFEFR